MSRLVEYIRRDASLNIDTQFQMIGVVIVQVRQGQKSSPLQKYHAL